MKTLILVAADDASLRARLARGLLRAGYAVELAENPRHAREVMARESVALAIVAPQGMGTAGTELAREIDDKINRLILVSESGNEVPDSHELQVGSNARLARTFTEQDLLARIKSQLDAPPSSLAAREHPSDSATARRDFQQLLTFEGYTLNAEARTCVDAFGRELTLTRAEFSLLLAFATKPGRVLSRDELSYAVAGHGAEPDDRSVDVLISRLRRKIEPDPKTPRIILTMPGEGYKFIGRPQSVELDRGVGVAPPAEAVVTKTEETEDRRISSGGARVRLVRIWAAVAAMVLIIVAAGWTARHFRTVSRQTATTAPGLFAPEQARRAMAYKRMLAAMHDDRFNWRTIERLAIESGVDETEAHEILAEHPDEVALGKSHDGKLLARLAAEHPDTIAKPGE